MTSTTPKILLGSGLSGLFLFVATAFAQTNDSPVASSMPDGQANIVSASFHQVLNNPASLTVIGFLCVFAWLCDDLPFINSRYVSHFTVMLGGGTYWLFAGPGSVPKNFPYPTAVLVVNGIMCGFAAFIVHRQAIARMISFVRERSGNTQFITKQKDQ